MTEEELNSYRFLSGEDPTDEMLECIMRDALECAMTRKREAEARIKVEVERYRKLHKEKWAARLKSYNKDNEVKVDVSENPSPFGDS